MTRYEWIVAEDRARYHCVDGGGGGACDADTNGNCDDWQLFEQPLPR